MTIINMGVGKAGAALLALFAVLMLASGASASVTMSTEGVVAYPKGTQGHNIPA